MKNIVLAAAGLALVCLTGCASTAYQGTQDVNAGPTYTEEEKANMTDEEKIAAHNDQVREKDQLICRKERRTGSHRNVTVCRTVAEKDEEEQNARDTLMKSRGVSGDPFATRGGGGN